MLNVEFLTQAIVNGGAPICLKNRVTIQDDESWLLRVTVPPDPKPVIELAGQAGTPVGVIIAAIRATFAAFGIEERPEPS